MKAKIIREDKYHAPQFEINEIVEIVPGMETDAEGIWNCPAGKLVLCKKADGTFAYNSLLDMQVVDDDREQRSDNSQYWTLFRAEAAKSILNGILSNEGSTENYNLRKYYYKNAITMADEFIKFLKGETE